MKLVLNSEVSLEENMWTAVIYLNTWKRFTKRDIAELSKLGLVPSDVLLEMKGSMSIQEADKIDKTGRM